MAPVPIFGEHLLYDSIDHAINAGKGPSNVAGSSSGWGDWSWGQAYSDWSPPEPRLFEDASIRELSQWEKFTESLFAADSWFGSWPSDKDTFMKAGSLAEFEDTGDGVVGDMPNLIIPQDEWWDLPRASRPKIPMSLDYQKPSSPVTTGRLEVPVNITTAQDVPLIPTRPTHIWPSEMIIPPTQYDPKRMVQEYGDKDWFLTKRWVPPAAADFGLPLGTCGSCDVTWQQASLVAAVGGVAVVILGLKISKIRTGRKTCKKYMC